MAGGELAMRLMKKMPDALVSLYMNLTLAITMYLAITINGGNFNTWRSFDSLDWILMLSLSVTTLASQSFRFLALQNH